ncbi:venom peptide isomerase heavy chain-like [Oppia nitens]|uniref:venom peptide isomerase heavy chain-like n=1 Tax=Oppia nitens TaxID=1686743 RepID=UPI0023DCBCF9|nr:venom peptide isomerase heavy chain-like [Oppia nitens]
MLLVPLIILQLILTDNTKDNGRRRSSRPPPKPFIVGGNDAQPGAYPWMAAIMDRTHGPMPWCGGSLITRQFILTAAHCFDISYTINDISVILGGYWFKPDGSGGGGAGSTKHRVDHIISHPGYNSHTKLHDIALVKLRAPVDSSSSSGGFRPIKLTLLDSYEGQSVRVLGWGLTQNPSVDSQAKQSELLQELDLQVWNNVDCSREIEAFGDGIVIVPTMLCAGGRDQGGQDACQHDSGGPLFTIVVDDNNGQLLPVLVGVVSAGIDCGLPRMPGIYTRVNQYIDWINQSMIRYD